jgi:NAD(P)-dependent dehydrogenase (short-subunit alcohol dehydrogenase family)/acyl carrier protein
VLNSLFGEAMEQSIGLVRPFGRFLELGKRDYYSDRKIGLRPFRRNISYFGIDADQLLLADAGLAQAMMADLSSQFAEGKLSPLPVRMFPADDIRSVFRLMQGSGHIGKIVVTPPVSGRQMVRRAASRPRSIDSDGVHALFGGLGGFGLATAGWLIAKGARIVALCSRSGVADAAAQEQIDRWRKSGITVEIRACDVTDRQQVAATLEHLRTLGPLRTIVHAAMVLDDALIENLTPERNRPVIDTKALGAEHLDLLTADDDLANFVLFSSVTTLFGNVGQANYVAANGYLEGVARRRRAAGKPALAVAFGPISDVGIIAKRSGLRDMLAHRLGEVGMTAAEALRQVDAYLVVDSGSVDAGSVVIANMDWSIISKLKVAKSGLFQPVMRAHGRHDASAGGSGDLKLLLADKTPSEAEAIVFGIVAEELATALQIPTTSILSSTTLKDVGLDSLMALELTMSLEKRTGLEVQLSGFSEPATIGMLVASIIARVNNESVDENGPNPELGALLARHAAA